MARSLREHDPESVLWVLCLDHFTHRYFEELADPQLRPVALSTLEEADPVLLATREERSRVEYYFTLSPCWPRYLLENEPTLDRITYLDADLFFFASPCAIFAEMGDRSVYITEHRYPGHLAHHQRFGRFNVAILSFRNDTDGRRCLDRWREQCLEWCRDHFEDGKYADQGYLDTWPEFLGENLCISARPGVNLAPWNWSSHRINTRGHGVRIDGYPLEIFHFARFRPTTSSFVFQSGQLEYGVMPWTVRQAIYGPYWQALAAARAEIRRLLPSFDFPKTRLRGWHGFWKALVPRLLFGSDWLRLGPYFISGRCSLGRYSAHVLTLRRRRKNRFAAENGLVSSLISRPEREPAEVP